MPYYYKPRTGGNAIPPSIQARTERRIIEFAHTHYAGKFTRLGIRFRGAFCYVDAYTAAPDAKGYKPPPGKTAAEWLDHLRNTPTHLCRIRYLGHEDRWSFAYYTYAHEKYEESFLDTGEHIGTPEEAFRTSAMFL